MTAKTGQLDLSDRLRVLNLWVLPAFVVAGLLGLGLYKEILYLGALAIGLRMLMDRNLAARLKPLLPVAVCSLILTIDGELAKPLIFDTTAPKFLSLFISAAASALSLATEPAKPSPVRLERGLATICAVFVVAHVVGCIARGANKGLFTNMHYLGLYAALTLPVLFYLLVEFRRAAWSAVVLLLLAGDFWLLLKSGSRPAWLALLLGTLGIVPFLGIHRRAAALMAAAALPTLLYLTGWFDFDARVDGLFKDFSSSEERVFIWNETLRMQTGTELWRWLFGHGFDTYKIGVASLTRHGRVTQFDFPHNFLLEILYVGGVAGLAVVLVGYSWLFRSMSIFLAGEFEPSRRRAALLLVALILIHLVDVFLTVSFFSSHNLVPLGLFLGLWLGLSGRTFPATTPLAPV